ncbi:deSI-like protein At4g17486 [Hibiscus syriacus]|nr:deSI-like protein At4g17486 [Hibiscus syriacus]
MLCRKNWSCVETGSEPVYLNVYDLTPINGYAYWFGLGVYHSGVQVHGVEYAFGAHEYPTTGIFEAEPKQCDGFTFRKSILIGKTELGPADVRGVMEDLADEFKGNAYNLITKNCNHFCNDVCIRLT